MISHLDHDLDSGQVGNPSLHSLLLWEEASLSCQTTLCSSQIRLRISERNIHERLGWKMHANTHVLRGTCGFCSITLNNTFLYLKFSTAAYTVAIMLLSLVIYFNFFFYPPFGNTLQNSCRCEREGYIFKQLLLLILWNLQ